MKPSDRRITLGAIPVAAVAGGIAATLLLGSSTNRTVQAQEVTKLITEDRTAAKSLEGAFINIADTIGPATVKIQTVFEESVSAMEFPKISPNDESPFGQMFPFSMKPRQGMPMPRTRMGQASGSGVIVRPDGYILTNDHVVAGAKNGMVKVTLSDNRTYTGKVYRDQRSDLAVVKIDTKRPLPYVRLADSDKIRVGQWAIAIGSPFGEQNTMTTGIVSALHRETGIGNGSDARYYPNLIQTDASINPGNSGGPLLNINGELMGVNVAIYSPSGANAGIGFAIPANTARTIMNQLIQNGKVVRGYLGLGPTDIPASLRDSLRLEQGARVATVEADTPASQAGIHAGDIITRFGDTPVSGQVTLRDAIASTKPGTSVPVTLIRDGATKTIPVTLGTLPDQGESTPTVAAPKPMTKLGLRVRTLTSEVARELSLSATTKGFVVVDVAPGSAAADVELNRGDVITRINGQPTSETNTLTRASNAAKSEDILTLTIIRPGNPNIEGSKPVEMVIDITIP